MSTHFHSSELEALSDLTPYHVRRPGRHPGVKGGLGAVVLHPPRKGFMLLPKALGGWGLRGAGLLWELRVGLPDTPGLGSRLSESEH